MSSRLPHPYRQRPRSPSHSPSRRDEHEPRRRPPYPDNRNDMNRNHHAQTQSGASKKRTRGNFHSSLSLSPSSSSSSSAASSSPSRKVMKRRRSISPNNNQASESKAELETPSSTRPTTHANSSEISKSSAPSSSDRFVWRKKIDQDRKQGRMTTEASEQERLKKLHEELMEAKRQREVRDAERKQLEDQLRQQAREKEREQYADDLHSEVSFTGRQHFLRQGIRLRERRPILLDSIAKYVRLDLFDLKWFHHFPHHHQQQQPQQHIQERLLDEIDQCIQVNNAEQLLQSIEEELDFIPDFSTELDTEVFHMPMRLEFWTCIKNVFNFKINDMKNNINGNDSNAIHKQVAADIDNMLKDKSNEKLSEMEKEICSKLNGNNDDENNIEFGEVDFWTETLRRIRNLIAINRLTSCVNTLQRERKRLVEDKRKEDELKGQNNEPTEDDDEDNHENYEKERDLLRAEVAKGMDENEQAFTDECIVENRKRKLNCYGNDNNNNNNNNNGGHHQSRRKPLYFNRVHTGYNWSKYNRTHYDHDNPPPKTVQGYKFNIFYPDLKDSTNTPTFHLTKTDNPDVSIITFKAAEPYDDLSFKIVNRPWEKSHKRGYRCCFDRGVLQLWFHFQHYRYRR